MKYPTIIYMCTTKYPTIKFNKITITFDMFKYKLKLWMLDFGQITELC